MVHSSLRTADRLGIGRFRTLRLNSRVAVVMKITDFADVRLRHETTNYRVRLVSPIQSVRWSKPRGMLAPALSDHGAVVDHSLVLYNSVAASALPSPSESASLTSQRPSPSVST